MPTLPTYLPLLPYPLLSTILNHVEYARSVSYEATIAITIIPVRVQYSGISTSADDRVNIWSVGAGGGLEKGHEAIHLYIRTGGYHCPVSKKKV